MRLWLSGPLMAQHLCLTCPGLDNTGFSVPIQQIWNQKSRGFGLTCSVITHIGVMIWCPHTFVCLCVLLTYNVLQMDNLVSSSSVWKKKDAITIRF